MKRGIVFVYIDTIYCYMPEMYSCKPAKLLTVRIRPGNKCIT